MPPTQTQDVISFFCISVPPPPDAELLVDTLDGYRIRHSAEPWPEGAFRWAVLPPHDRRDTVAG